MQNQMQKSLFILVLGSPTDSQAALTAFNFAQAAIHQCKIRAVFFNSMAASTANNLSVTPQDELDLNHSWSEFKQTHNIQLFSCISASLKRGVLNKEEAARYNKGCHNLAPAFQLTGLGTLADYLVNTDKTITFK